jgi:tripartite-type tricarboxylate transporter receptor subunit TctC
MVVGPNIAAGATYDPIKDFRPIVLSARTPLSFVGANALPAKTVSEIVALAKAKPDDLKLAHSGVGSPPHLGAVAFLQATATKMVLVPYRGAAPAIQDIVAGHVQLLFTAPSTSIQLGRDGKVRILGVTGHQRMKSMPEVPTLRESGIDMGGIDANQWFGLAAPAGTPDYVVARIMRPSTRCSRTRLCRRKSASSSSRSPAARPRRRRRWAARRRSSGTRRWRRPASSRSERGRCKPSFKSMSARHPEADIISDYDGVTRARRSCPAFWSRNRWRRGARAIALQAARWCG